MASNDDVDWMRCGHFLFVQTALNYKLIFYFIFLAFVTFKFAVPFARRWWKIRSRPLAQTSLKTSGWPSHEENAEFIHYSRKRLDEDEIVQKSEEFYHLMNSRRTVRFYSKEPVPKQMIDFIIKTAGTSPSGAHKQPWTFVVVSKPEIKSELRRIVEAEEEINYERRMSKEWVTALNFCKTDWVKPYIEEAPYVILIFKKIYSFDSDGNKINHYYVEQSLSIAAGILITAIHYCGLVTLTSTPLNCGPAISTLCQRPRNEKLVYLLPVGFPSPDCTVPNIKRKPLEEIAVYI